MAAKLNIIGDIAVDGADVPQHKQVQIIVRDNAIMVTRGTAKLAQKSGVVAVENTGARAWLIRFDDGTSWAAQRPARKGGCGCR